MEVNADAPSLAELKVEELLKEARVKYPPPDAVQAVLSAIRSCFQRIPEHQVTSSLALSFVESLGVPVDKAKFSFKNPIFVDIVGSFATETMAKPMQTMDLSFQIPKGCFHEKDFLNHRYHAKRALYLAILRIHLNKCSFVKRTTWTLLHHDARKPLLLVQLESKFRPDFNFDILLVPFIGRDVFNISKLGPSRNNIKMSSSEFGSEATPHYNASIIEDMVMEAHCSHLKAAFSQYNGLRDTVLLLKVWIRQRGFPNMLDSLNGFLMSMLLAHLIHTGEQKVTGNTSSFQIFKVFMESLASGRLEKGLFLSQTSSKISKEAKGDYSRFYDVVMLDTLELCNIGFRLTKNAVTEIKEAASNTIAAMKSSRDFGFNEIFLTTIDFSSKFDYHVRVCMKHEPAKPLSFADEDKCRDVEKQVLKILSEGLGTRVSLVRVYGRPPPPNWSLEGGMETSRGLPIFVGIVLSNFEAGYRMVDVGPSADNVDAARKFRTFWGEKAELRRFKDGTISETAVWECEATQRHLIIPKIVHYLLPRHLSLSLSDIYVSGEQLDHTLMEKERNLPALVPNLLQAFDLLSKRIRGLEDLPLKISTVQPLHAAFRHAAVFPPNMHALADERPSEGFSKDGVASCIDPCEVMVQLEGSGRWPTNRQVIEKTKLAFCLKIAESMHRIYGVKCVAAEDSVDLLMHGFCFRLKLFYDKDPTSVQARNTLTSNAKDLSRLSEASTAVSLQALQNDLMLHSLHASMLSGLHGRYPTYGPIVRLAKRWVGSHLFSDVLKEQAIELLVAYLFLRPAPYSPPLSRITGFLRFLQLLKNYDWALSPLIVDLNGDFTSKELDFIWDEFNRGRKHDLSDLQQAAMFIAAPYDMRSHTWTACSPNQPMLRRLVAYARTSAELLNKLLKGESTERWPSLFCTPLNTYDIILKIEPSKLPHPRRVLYPANVKAAVRVLIKAPEDHFKPWLPKAVASKKSTNVEKELLIGFDPTVCLIQDLKAKFGDIFNYWYDHIGSTVVCLSWKSSSNQELSKKRKRAEEEKEILIELGRLGAGYVESIHVVGTCVNSNSL